MSNYEGCFDVLELWVIKHRENNIENKWFIYVCIYLT